MNRVLYSIPFALCIAGQPAAAAAPEPLPAVALELVAEGFNAPIFLVAPPDRSGRRFIGEQMGVVYVLTAEGKRLETPFLDLRDQMVALLKAFDERGLLALAFHPDFAKNGLFYVNYSAKRRPESPFDGTTAYTWRTSEFKVSAADRNRADRATERVLI